MSASSNRTWGPGPSAGPAGPGSNLRLSDAERTEIADRLAKHYEEGRLDQAEFNERVDQVMRAKTMADLDGVFADLPPAAAPAFMGRAAGGGPPAGLRGRRRHPVLFLALVILLAVIAAHTVGWFFFVPWPWLVILVAVAVYACRRPRRHD